MLWLIWSITLKKQMIAYFVTFVRSHYFSLIVDLSSPVIYFFSGNFYRYGNVKKGYFASSIVYPFDTIFAVDILCVFIKE